MIQSGMAILIIAMTSANRNNIPETIVNLSIFALRIVDSRQELALRSKYSPLHLRGPDTLLSRTVTSNDHRRDFIRVSSREDVIIY